MTPLSTTCVICFYLVPFSSYLSLKIIRWPWIWVTVLVLVFVLVGWRTGRLISLCRDCRRYLYDMSGRMHSWNCWRTLRSRLLQEECSNCWPLSGWRRIFLCLVFICLCSISSRVLWFRTDSQLIWRTVYDLSVLSLSVICILQPWAFRPLETWCLSSSVWQDNCTSSTVVLDLLLLSGLFPLMS